MEQDLLRLYQDIADDKGLDLQVICAPNLPQTLETDAQRLQQILRNLLTNAFKFTHEGAVTLNMALPSPEQAKLLDKPREALIAFSVKDDGIGIKQEQQLAIFQAFQQADGSTSRKYEGSIFTVIFPTRYEVKDSESQPTLSPISLAPMEPMDVVEREEPTPPAQDAPSVEKEPVPQLNGFKKADSIKQDNDSYVEDDRQTVVPEDRTLLIIEDDRALKKKQYGHNTPYFR